MSSYLSKLAARALEQPQPIRPRLASLFEPVAGPRVRLFETTATRRARTPQSTIPARDPAPTKIAREVIQPRPIDLPADAAIAVREAPKEPMKSTAPPRAETESLIRPASQTPLIEAPVVTDRPEESVLVLARSPTEPSSGETTVIDHEAFRPEQPSAAIQIVPLIGLDQNTVVETVIGQTAPGEAIRSVNAENRPEALRAPTVTISPSRSHLTPEMSLEAPSIEAAGSIRITIGRVDVRAIMPQPQPAAPARRPVAAGGALSLGEYLKQRNGA